MPLISNVGRSSFRLRSVIILIYLGLSLGALTMVYPFILMLSTSFKSYADFEEYNVIPRYFFNDTMLFKKYIVDKVKIKYLGIQYGKEWYSARDIKVEQIVVDSEKSVLDKAKQKLTGKTAYSKKVMKTVNPLGEYFTHDPSQLNKIVEDWYEFFPQCPTLYKFAYFAHTGARNYSILDIKPQYRKWLKKKYKTIDALNKAYIDNAKEFEEVSMPYEDPLRQRWLLPLDEKYTDWQAFKGQLPKYKIWIITAELAFQTYLQSKFPDIKVLSEKAGLTIKKYSDLNLSYVIKNKILPENIISDFIRRKCPVIFLKLDSSLKGDFKEFVRNKYKKYSEKLRQQKENIEFTQLCPMDKNYSGRSNDWIEFMEKKAPLDKISFKDPMFMYQNFLERKYETIDKVNNAYGLQFNDFANITLPVPWIDYDGFNKHKSSIFQRYLTGNYKMVLTVITVHGRALINTIIYVLLAIACTLTINPLAAYALSRYKLKYTNTILLFLLATMAFPPSVGMIPNFLLLKDLGFLNTFLALLVPVLANGYAIFLLKGFFDSLPDEIYEAAIIDGASEFQIFIRMALPLTKPILAIMALRAFTMAYGAFMFAFLTCQDPKMWTLMVFLYEFQQTYPNYLVMASLIIAAIPTLMVFIFCQNIILRGIVIPSFK